LHNACWCVTCCCYGTGLSSPVSPCIYSRNKFLCCRGTTTSGAEYCGPLGIYSNLSKFLCVINHAEFPPEQCRLGLCNVFCLGGVPSVPMIMTARQAEDISFFQNSFWCWYCCCQGCGCTNCCDPLVKGRQKVCCVMCENETTEFCGPEGCCFGVSKTACLTMHSQCPPAMTPGIGCCGCAILGNLGTNQGRDVLIVSAPNQMQMQGR